MGGRYAKGVVPFCEAAAPVPLFPQSAPKGHQVREGGAFTQNRYSATYSKPVCIGQEPRIVFPDIAAFYCTPPYQRVQTA